MSRMESKDSVSLLVYNSDDSTFLVLMNPEYMVRLPNKKVGKQGWMQTARLTLQELLGVESRLINLSLLFRIWMGEEFAHHVVFHITVNNELLKKKKPLESEYRHMWKSEGEMAKFDFASPEMLTFFQNPVDRERSLKSLEVTAQVTGSSLIEALREHFLVGMTVKDVFEHLVVGLAWSEADQISTLSFFLTLTFPCILMGLQVFRKLMKSQEMMEDRIQALFRAGDLTNRGAMTFKEFLCLMAFVDPQANLTQPVCLEAQARYTFRYFDSSRNGVWTIREVEAYFTEIMRKGRKVTPGLSVEKEVVKFYREIEVMAGAEITLLHFVKAVGAGRLRIPVGFLKSNKKLCDLIKEQSMRSVSAKSAQSISQKKPVVNVTMAGDKKFIQDTRNYNFAYHVVKMGKNGYIDHSTIDRMATRCMTPTSATVNFASTNSTINFSVDSPANEVLLGLKYFAQTTSVQSNKNKEPFTWEKVEYNSLGRLIIQLSTQVEEILRAEKRLVEVPTPAYILGDIHGNYVDLYLFECALWPSGMHLSLGNIVFLGDYVDRGIHGVEVIGYLFANKVKNPNKLFLIRGNHEIRVVQRQFTFFNECIRKFGKEFGQDVWRAINNAFDSMPLAAVVDGQLFCCHGGVPPPWLCPTMTVINNIPVPLTNPEAQSALAWELLWNDPIKDEDLQNDAVLTELSLNDGFAVNKRRGTAHMFNSAALSKFLKVNNLSYAVRAHEVVECGFKVQLSSKLMTIFSSSFYSGMTNKAACLQVSDYKIRIFHLHSEEFHRSEGR